MSIFCKRLELAAVAAAIGAAAAVPGPAAAQVGGGVVYCTNCGEEYTQWLNHLQLASQLEKQAAQLEIAIRNAAALSNFTTGAGFSDLRAVTAILKQAKALSYASSGLDAKFSKKFKDYSAYAASKLDVSTMAAKYQQWSEDASSAARTTLKAAGLQATQIEGAEEQTLKTLESQAKSAKGGLEAQQVALALSIETVRQIQKLRQLILMNMQLAANYGQIGADRRAARQAAWKQFTKKPEVATNNGAAFRAGE
jgi:P-type conjugative transfer protein TrbJ